MTGRDERVAEVKQLRRDLERSDVEVRMATSSLKDLKERTDEWVRGKGPKSACRYAVDSEKGNDERMKEAAAFGWASVMANDVMMRKMFC